MRLKSIRAFDLFPANVALVSIVWAARLPFRAGQIGRRDLCSVRRGRLSGACSSMLHGGVERFEFSQRWLDHGYKELHIPAALGGGFLMDKNALHIWPRHKFMMIALPNFDGSFTCTLFLAHKGDDGFDKLADKACLMRFFEENFPDAVPLMPTLAEDFFHNPVGNLGTIKCFPWNVGGKALLLGDSAHAIVPFYGQGMNCAFEDVRVLDSAYRKTWHRMGFGLQRIRRASQGKHRRDRRHGGREFLRNARRGCRSGLRTQTRTRNKTRTNISGLFFKILNGHVPRGPALFGRQRKGQRSG